MATDKAQTVTSTSSNSPYYKTLSQHYVLVQFVYYVIVLRMQSAETFGPNQLKWRNPSPQTHNYML